MKKFLCIFLLLTLFACADSMDYSYKFKDLTINIPVDVVLESKVITGDYTDFVKLVNELEIEMLNKYLELL